MKFHKINGFSLVELMIAITISVVLLTGLIQVYISAKQSYLIQDSIARMQENGRYALDRVSTDLRLAGYLGGNADPDMVLGSEPANNDCVSSDDEVWGAMVEQGLFAINDSIGSYGGCITAAGASPSKNEYLIGDILTIRYAKPTQLVDGAEVNRDGYYLVSSPFGGELSLLGDGDNNIISSAGIDGEPITFNRFEAYSYFIGHQVASCDGIDVNVPALQRLFLENGAPQTEELIRGVENLQVQFGVDGNNDGVLDQYQNANTIADWDQVKSVRLWLLIRDECPGAGGYINNNTYVMGDFQAGNATPGYTPNDRFRRQLYTSTIMLRNNETI